MKIARITSSLILSAALLSPLAGYAQYTQADRHEDAKDAQAAHDARHHTGAKIVGGSAVGGAVAGGLLAGPKGAIVGAGVGAGAGAIANKVRVNKDVKKREQREDHEQYERREPPPPR